MNTKSKVLVFRWSIVTAAGFALFWAIWYLFVGKVPTITFAIGALPISVSRWWDVICCPIWTAISIMLSPLVHNDESFADWMLVFAIAVTLFLGTLSGLIVGFVFALCLTLGLAFIAGFIYLLHIGLLKVCHSQKTISVFRWLSATDK